MAPLVEFAGVAFGYPRPALSREGGFSLTDVSFAIEPGEIFGVIGPNSAGKTTLLRLLTRVVSADRGEIRLAGRPIAPMAHAELARQVAAGSGGGSTAARKRSVRGGDKCRSPGCRPEDGVRRGCLRSCPRRCWR